MDLLSAAVTPAQHTAARLTFPGCTAWSTLYSPSTEHLFMALAIRRCLSLCALSQIGCTADGCWVRCFLEGSGDALFPALNLLFRKFQAEILQPQQEFKAGITLLNPGISARPGG